MWFPLALATALFWGTGQVFVKTGLRYLTPLANNIVINILILLTYLPLGLYGGVSWNKLISTLPLILAATGLYTVYYYALEKGQVSLSGTIIASYPLVTIFLSRLFLLERTSTWQKYAIILILIGAALLAAPSQKQRKVKLFQAWLIWALASAICSGTGDFLSKIVIDRSSTYTLLFGSALAGIPVSLGLFAIDKKGRHLPKLKAGKIIPTLIGLLLMQFGGIAYSFGFSFGPASLVSSTSSSYAAISVILALIFLKEKLTRQQVIGVITTVSGIILIGLA
jgi:transporter family protein